ncbi:aminotransferase class V-fold PLP-dependent enzyme [Streptomyces cyaneofuscatus]
MLGSAAATRYARKVGLKAIEQRTPALAARLRDRLRPLPGVRVLDRGPRLAALVTFDVEGWQPQPFKEAMDARGINSALSFREFAQFDFADKDVEWCLRLSPHYYNTEEEVDHVADAVADLAGRGVTMTATKTRATEPRRSNARHHLSGRAGEAVGHARRRPPQRAAGAFDVLPGESNGGGYEIRTREGLPPTRFPSPRLSIRSEPYVS